ncbi:unnamed protein product [Rhizophagus irregularis]|nr:unnamed protein product [Rhizophagus irregularis]
MPFVSLAIKMFSITPSEASQNSFRYEFDEFEELDGFGDAMEDLEPSDHAPRFTSLNISSIANLDHTVLYDTPGQTKMCLFFACLSV